MKKITSVLIILLMFISCSAKDKATKNNNILNDEGQEEIVNYVVETNKNNEYVIADWDRLIETWLQENQDLKRGRPYHADGYVLWDIYAPDYEIATLAVLFDHFDFFDGYFSREEKDAIIRSIKEKYSFYDGEGIYRYEFEDRFAKHAASVDYSEFVKDTWKMIFSLLRINHYSNILNAYLSQEDKDRIQAKALIDFFKTKDSWPPIYFYADIGFPQFTYVSFSDNVATYSIKRNRGSESENPENVIIHYRTESGEVNAVYIDHLDNYDYFYNLGFRMWHQYDVMGKLKEDVYLFTNHNHMGGSYRVIIALTLTENNLEPYPAFSGSNVLFFPANSAFSHFEHTRSSTPRYERSVFYHGITVFYNQRASATPNDQGLHLPVYDTLELVFNGIEFEGDYNLLGELVRID